MARILVAEGDSFMAKFYTVKLQDLGHEVEMVLSGEKALEQLKLKRFDAIVLDIVLPYRDGLTLLQDIRKMRKHMKAKIVASEIQQKISIKKAKELGADYYFVKNESQVYELIDTLQAMLKNKRIPVTSGIKLSKTTKTPRINKEIPQDPSISTQSQATKQ